MNNILEKVFKSMDCGEKTVPSRNCETIENKLIKHCIPVKYVARHELFGIHYFELVMDEEINKSVFEEDICRIFDIPKEWVGFTSVDPKILCIKENEMIERFGDCNGLLHFDKWNIKNKSWKEVEQRLLEHGINAVISTDFCGEFEFYSIQLMNDCVDVDFTSIKRALNVSDVGVIECNKIYIVERIRE